MSLKQQPKSSDLHSDLPARTCPLAMENTDCFQVQSLQGLHSIEPKTSSFQQAPSQRLITVRVSGSGPFCPKQANLTSCQSSPLGWPKLCQIRKTSEALCAQFCFLTSFLSQLSKSAPRLEHLSSLVYLPPPFSSTGITSPQCLPLINL